MALIMNEEQREKALKDYDPRGHLISVGTNKDRSPVLYYPAAWRLYELRLRHPHFTLEAEIIHMDEEKGTCIVKAIGYDGLDYASSNLKGTALKQGKLTELDKVETKAKSRVARDVGIGTEYALDMTADETDATHDDLPERVLARETTAEVPIPINAPLVSELRERHKFLGMKDDFETIKFKLLKRKLTDDEMSPEMCIHINGFFDQVYEKQAKSA